MADPISTQILDNLVSTIAAIEAGDTYYRTIRECRRLTYEPEQLSQYDAVFIYDNGCSKDYLASGVTRCQQSILLDCWVRDNDVADAVDKMAADIEKALSVDVTRNDLAIDTRIVSVRKYMTEAKRPEGNCEMDVVVVYRHAEGDPYTAI